MQSKNYYVSYQYSYSTVTGFGSVSLTNLVLKHPNDVMVLANKIAEIMKIPANSVVILFFKDFESEISELPKFG